MGVVSVRIPDEAEARLVKAGLQPAAVAKAALEAELRKLAVLEQMSALEKLRFKARRPSEEVIREIRDRE